MEKELNEVDILSFVIHGTIGVRLLTIPRDIVEHANNNGWMSVLLSSIILFYLGYSFYWLGTRHPGLNISQIMEVTLGKFLGKLVMVGLAIYIITSIGLSLRTVSGSIKTFLLDTTPLVVVIILMIIPIVYGVSKGIKTMSIVLDMLLPIVITGIILLIGLSLNNVEIENLRPVFYGGVTPVLKGSLELVHPYLGIGIIGYILPRFKDSKATKKWIAIGIIITSLIYLAIILLVIIVFGTEETKMLIWPTIVLSKAIQLETELFERAESLFMVIWIPLTFTTMVTFYYSSVLNIKALFDSNRDNLITYGQIPLFIVIATLPGSSPEVYNYLDWVNRLAQFITFVIIPIMICITLIKKRRKRTS